MKAQFWAEDGAVFFADQLKFGFFRALSSTYAGYYHVLPRIIAGAASVLPAQYVPLAYNLAALLLASLCCGLFAWPICRHLIPSDALRIAACFVMASAAYAGDEVIGNITNIQWFLLIAAVILTAFQETASAKPARVNFCVALAGLLIALSAPLALILSPWLIWQIFRKKGLARLPALSMLLGTVFEACTFLRSSEPHASLLKLKLSLSFVAVIATEISRPVLATFLGHGYLAKGGAIGVAGKFIAALILVSVWLTRLYSAIDHRSRKIVTVALYLSLSSIAVVMAGRNLAAAYMDPYGFRYLQGERYFFLPACTFIFLAAFSLDRMMRGRNDLLKAAALILLFTYGMAKNFELPPFTDLSWKSYAARIDDWAAKRSRGEHVSPLIVPINPAPFTMHLE